MAALTRLRRLAFQSAEAGSELLELALALPILLMVIAGIMDFGFFFERYEVVTNAAREGARAAVLNGYSCDNTTTSDVYNRVEQYLTSSGLTNTPIVNCGAPSGTGFNNLSYGVLQIRVTYPTSLPFVSSFAGLVGGSSLGTINLTAVATMRPEIDTASGS